MAISSIKGCWFKFSARIRDYLDTDFYYRPDENGDSRISRIIHKCEHNAIGRPNRDTVGASTNVSNKPHHHGHSHHHNCPTTGHDQGTAKAASSQSSRHRLPPGYTKRKTSHGQVYFVDSHGQQSWYDPSVPKELISAPLNLDALVGRLSSNWQVRQTESGKTYFVNHNKKTTQFTDPRLVYYKDQLMNLLKYGALCSNGSRPLAYQAQNNNNIDTNANNSSTMSTSGRTANLRRQLCSALHPANISQQNSGSVGNLFSLSANMPPTTNLGPPVEPPYNNNVNQHHHHQQHVKGNSKELFDKISILRQELLKQQVLAHPCRIDVNRKRIFEESFRVISQMQPRDLKKRLLVKFRGEEGLDYGGVAREWFYLLSREILNPVHGLFQYTSGDIYNLQINPDSGIVYREHLSYLNFCGRVIGMAVFHGHFIEGHFTLPFYKMLLRKPISLEDIEFVDPDLHRSLCWILENDITNVIDTTFLVQHNAFGQLQEHELKENGRNIAVTEENKREYVSLYVNYRCRRGIESQFEALQRGFYELVSPSLVEAFDEHELELLIGGLSKINVDDWRTHTKLKNCTVETPLVRWFWDIVKSYSEDKRARLLQFVTGSPRVPIQGFKALQGVNSELRLFTIHLIKNACTDNLPKSHTCFNRIDLPPYESYERLRDKLTQAIEETMGFAMQ